MLKRMRRVALVGAWVLAVLATPALSTACGKATMESRVNAYQRSKDRLEVLGSKMPAMKADIQAKVAEFETAFQAANEKGGEQGVREIGALIARMDAYEKQMNPTTPVAAPGVGTKLAPVGQPAVAPPGSKLTPGGVPPAGVRPAPVQGGAVPMGMPTRQPAVPGQLQQVPTRQHPQPMQPMQPVQPVQPVQPAQPGGSGFGGQ
ncbi:MAG: hypothetical protein H6744_14915 [Deltaproteobacteria bacterium]|nr:hypothetical protein [Deltaproteobacteria bacterium]